MTLAASVRDFCRRHGRQHVWIALSGGLDSRVLLDVCHRIRADTSLEFHVIHVHHGLNPQADSWVRQCEAFCQDYGFDFQFSYINLDISSKVSLEEAARDARYQVFSGLMQPDDLLLTAHHQNDQAETLLLQLARGSGLKGLAAMPIIKTFAAGLHGRPLLAYSRQELLDYAKTHQLTWVEDDSNTNCEYTRNFIRHEVIPVLKSRWPSIENSLARTAAHCAEAQELLQEVALEKLEAVQGSVQGTLSASKLLSHRVAWQRLLLREWIALQGFPMPDTNKMSSILASVLSSAWDKNPSVRWGEISLRRHRDNLHLVLDEKKVFVVGQGLSVPFEGLTIRNRVLGETVEIVNRGRVSLKNLFQEWQVPAWERGSLPLLFCGEKLIQVPGYYQDPAYFECV
jgi:tRNA(Ile)-lysidine synthase